MLVQYVMKEHLDAEMYVNMKWWHQNLKKMKLVSRLSCKTSSNDQSLRWLSNVTSASVQAGAGEGRMPLR